MRGAVIGLDDLLHEGMAHDVLRREPADGDVVDPVENAHGLLETGGLVRREVDLRDVAGDDDVGAEADAREEHFHLLAGGVLRLVQDDEAVVQRAAAHVGERGDLDVAALEIFLIRLGAEHLKERVVQRAEIRVDLALQIAGQEAQPLPRFDGGAREDDAVDALGAEGGDRLRHGEIGLARAGGADAEGDRVLLDRVEIAALADGLGLDGLALGRDAHDVAGELADLLLASFADELEDVAHVLLGDLLSLCGELQKAGERLLRLHDGLRLAGDVDLRVPVRDVDAVLRLDEAEVLVKRAEDADDVLNAVNLYRLFDHAWVSSLL